MRISTILENETKRLVAWDWEDFPVEHRPVYARRSGWGTNYRFKDDSRGHVMKGTYILLDTTDNGYNR